MVHREVAQHACLNLDFLRIGFPLHFVAGNQFFLRHHAEALKHLDALGVEVALKDFRARLLHVEAAFLCLCHPLVAVAVAVESDGFAGLDVIAQDVDDGMEGGVVLCALKLLGGLGDACVNAFLEAEECLCHCGVQCYHRTGAVRLRTHGTELKAVAGEGERTGAVAVGVVDEQFGNLGDVHLHALLAVHGEDILPVRLLDVVEEFAHLFAEER